MRRTFTVKAGDLLLGVRCSPKQAVDLMFAAGVGAHAHASDWIARSDWRWSLDSGDRVDTTLRNDLRIQAYRDDR